MRDKLNRYESRIRELDEERKKDSIEQKQNEMLLKQSFEDRLRTIHESHLIDLKQSAEVQKIKMSHLEEMESSLRDTKSKRSMNSDEMSAREMSIITQERKLKGRTLYVLFYNCRYNIQLVQLLYLRRLAGRSGQTVGSAGRRKGVPPGENGRVSIEKRQRT